MFKKGGRQNKMSAAPFFCPFTKKIRQDVKTRHFLKRLGFALLPPPSSTAFLKDAAAPVHLPRLDDAHKLIRHLQLHQNILQQSTQKKKYKDAKSAGPLSDHSSHNDTNVVPGIGVSRPYRKLVHGTLQRELNGAFASVVMSAAGEQRPSSPTSSSVGLQSMDLNNVETFRIAVRGYVDQCVAELTSTGPPTSTSTTDDDVVQSVKKTSKTASEDSLSLLEGLTDDQSAAFSICHAGKCVYLGGNAGTGKSFLLDRIARHMEGRYPNSAATSSSTGGRGGGRVLRTAMTGIAAVNIGGTTLHSALKINVPTKQAPLYSASSFQNWYVFKTIDVLIVDEVSMMEGGIIEAMDEVARSARGRHDVPFGGIQVILSGDFLQLAPTTLSLLQCSTFTKSFIQLALTQPMRQQHDPSFLRDLNQLRLGVLSDSIRNSALLNPPSPDAIRLFPTRHAARHYNKLCLQNLPGAEFEFRSFLRVNQLSEGWCEAIAIHLYLGRLGAKRKLMLEQYLREALCAECELDQDELALNFEADVCNTTVAVLVRGRAWGKILSGETSAALQRAADCVLQKHNLSGCVVAPSLAKTNKNDVIQHQDDKVDDQTRDAQRSTNRDLMRRQRTAMREIERDATIGHKTLKKGSRVMLVRNLSHVLVNGSIGTIVDFLDPKDAKNCQYLPRDLRVQTNFVNNTDGSSGLYPLVKFDNEEDHKTPVLIPYIEAELPDYSTEGFLEVSLRTLPLIPAFAFTVHKVQGVTIRSPVLLDCSSMWRCHHIVYVAASRVQKFEHLRIVNLLDHHVAVCPQAFQFSMQLKPAAEVLRALDIPSVQRTPAMNAHERDPPLSPATPIA